MKVFSASETTVAYKVTRTMTGVECDVCHKVIPVAKKGDDRYFTVTTGHHDWGHDSIESREIVDVCPECLNKYIADYFEESKGSYTAYLEVETENVWAEKETKVLDKPPKDGEITKQRHDIW